MKNNSDLVKVKTCSKCGIEKPATKDFFSKGEGKFNLRGVCKSCQSKYDCERRKKSIILTNKKCASPYCTNEITISSSYAHKKYCSKKCLDKASRDRVRPKKLVKCANPRCNSEFVNTHGRKFCSIKCSNSWSSERWRLQNTEHYHRIQDNISEQKKTIRLKRQRYTCVLCGNELIQNKAGTKRWCSKKCRRKFYMTTHKEESAQRSKSYVNAAGNKYIKSLIAIKTNINKEIIPSDMIEVYREQLKLKRKIYEKQRNTTNIL